MDAKQAAKDFLVILQHKLLPSLSVIFTANHTDPFIQLKAAKALLKIAHESAGTAQLVYENAEDAFDNVEDTRVCLTLVIEECDRLLSPDEEDEKIEQTV